MTTIGVDQDMARALDAEALIDRARARLTEAGLGRGLWICTHDVPGDSGNHVAYGVVVEAECSDELMSTVMAAFTSDSPSGEAAGGAHHVHQEPGRTCVWCQDRWEGSSGLVDQARAAAQAQESLVAGRAVVYPGEELMRGEVLLTDVVGRTAIDRIHPMGGVVDDGTVLVTRDHVRPLRRDGQWVLHVQPARGGVQVPFEAPVHRSCCSEHV